MKELSLNEEWEDGVLYRVFLVQQELPIFAEYDYSAQWELIVKALEMDMNKEKVFSFVHPKNGKKVYMRKYAKCPANGNSELAVGTMEGPRDFARALIVLHSHMYKVPYIVLERYRHISNNPDVMAKMIERAFNWALRDTSVRVVLERWDTKGEYIDYHKDSRASWDIEFDKSNGKNLVKMGYEDALEVYKRKEATKKKADKKSDDICRYIKMPNPGLVLSWLHDVLKGRKTAKEISMPFRFILERVYPERIPYKAVVAEFPEVEVYLKQKRYDEWINKNNVVYNIDTIFEELQRSFEEYTGMNIANIIFKKRS